MTKNSLIKRLGMLVIGGAVAIMSSRNALALKNSANGKYISEEKIEEFLSVTNIGQKVCGDF